MVANCILVYIPANSLGVCIVILYYWLALRRFFVIDVKKLLALILLF